MQELEPQIRAQIDAAASEWRQAVESVVGSFTAARTARERAIADPAPRPPARTPFNQACSIAAPNAARARLAAAAADAESAAADRLAAFARSNAITPRPAQLLLVLAP